MPELPQYSDTDRDSLRRIVKNTAEMVSAAGGSTGGTTLGDIKVVLDAINAKESTNNTLLASIDADTSELVVNGKDKCLRVDTVTFAGETVLGNALPGSSNAAAVWKIVRFDANGNSTYADGNSNYDNIWNNRGALSYS